MSNYKLVKENKKLKGKLVRNKVLSYLVPISTVAISSTLFLSGKIDFSNPKIFTDILIFTASANSLSYYYRFKAEDEINNKIKNNEQIIEDFSLDECIKTLNQNEKNILINYLNSCDDLINLEENYVLLYIIENYDSEKIREKLEEHKKLLK